MALEGIQCRGCHLLPAARDTGTGSRTTRTGTRRLHSPLGGVVLRSGRSFPVRGDRSRVRAVRLRLTALADARLSRALPGVLPGVGALPAGTGLPLRRHEDQLLGGFQAYRTLRGEYPRLGGFLHAPRREVQALADLIDGGNGILDLLDTQLGD